ISSMAATNDYYRGHLGSSSSNGSCALYPGEAIPHHPGVPKAQPGHWWGSFFFGKSTLLIMATVLESPEQPRSPQASRAPFCSFTSSRLSRQDPVGLLSTKAFPWPLIIS
uniref:Pancreatic progenitor cell differentiation and proliferation factor n=1 Tax=Bos mutus grunniens TaxID=30521 RepID=A0A8B9X412_BOSMU